MAEKQAHISTDVGIQHVDTYGSDKKEVEVVGRDYAGAAEKTDPVEIALVKKLDWRIMVRLT